MSANKILMAESDVPYPPFQADNVLYADKHVAGARRNDIKQPYVDYGTERHEDKERYLSRAVMELEWKKIWSKKWILCGHESDLPKTGSYMKVELGRESILVVRQKDKSLKAFYNVCQHRGTQLVTKDFGTLQRFTCPFHAWQFGLDGKCLKVTDRESFRAEALNYDVDIAAVHVDSWKGWVFISLNDKPTSLREFLGEDFMKRLDAYPWEEMKRVADFRQEWDVNWKLAMEAFLEGYHVQGVHPQLLRIVDTYRVQIDTYANGLGVEMSRFLVPSVQFASRLSAEGQLVLTPEHEMFLREAGIDPATFKGGPLDARAAIIKAKREYAKQKGYSFEAFDDEQLVDDWTVKFFPTCTFNAHPEGVIVQRWLPHPTDPEKMTYSAQTWALPNRELPSYMSVPADSDRTGDTILEPLHVPKGDLKPLEPVINQDATTLPLMQSRLRSKGFKGSVYSEQELMIRQFYAEYERCLQSEE